MLAPRGGRELTARRPQEIGHPGFRSSIPTLFSESRLSRVVDSEWVDWHRGYEKDGRLVRRLQVVRDRIREVLDGRPPGPVKVLSLCAGDGRDLLGVLETHPRAADVRACLVDSNRALVEAGERHASRIAGATIEFRLADASTTDSAAGAVPADLVLACGIFGNVSDADIRNTVHHLPELCSVSGTVIWTRKRTEPDVTPSVRGWFDEEGFQELAFVPIPDSTASVGVHRLVSPPRPFRPGVQLFTFLPKEKRP